MTFTAALIAFTVLTMILLATQIIFTYATQALAMDFLPIAVPMSSNPH